MRPAVYEAIRESIKADMVVLVTGEVAEDTFNGGIKIDAEQVVTLADARVEKSRAIQLTVHSETYTSEQLPTQLQALTSLLAEYQAEQGLPIEINYQNNTARVKLKNTQTRYFPDDELLETLHSQGWKPEVV